jgi:predicted transcriptional regulator
MEVAPVPDDIEIEARIPQMLDEALGRVALATGRSKSSLVCEAVTAFILSEDEFIAAVEEGRAAARRGDLMDHDQVIRDIKGLITPKR